MIIGIDKKSFGETFLEEIVDWIKYNLGPNEVFDDNELILWMRDEFHPDEVFEDDDLIKWALNNGYKKEEDWE